MRARQIRAAHVRAVVAVTAIQFARYGVIHLGLWIAPVLGIDGWDRGLFVNVLCCVYAAGIATWSGAWRDSGIVRRWGGWIAVFWLVPLAFEALAWLVPHGMASSLEGVAWPWWVVNLLLVGFNEELICRGVILPCLERAFGAGTAVSLAALAFGLQHLSAFTTGDAPAGDILWNVLLTAVYGFALGAWQHRFRWLWPLIALHAVSDLTSLLSPESPRDLVIAVVYPGLILAGVLLLAGESPRVTHHATAIGAGGSETR
ncbi:MAG: CPBP family intramembrane metalloprotease [Thermomicrobiales bacterium]